MTNGPNPDTSAPVEDVRIVAGRRTRRPVTHSTAPPDMTPDVDPDVYEVFIFSFNYLFYLMVI